MLSKRLIGLATALPLTVLMITTANAGPLDQYRQASLELGLLMGLEIGASSIAAELPDGYGEHDYRRKTRLEMGVLFAKKIESQKALFSKPEVQSALKEIVKDIETIKETERNSNENQKQFARIAERLKSLVAIENEIYLASIAEVRALITESKNIDNLTPLITSALDKVRKEVRDIEESYFEAKSKIGEAKEKQAVAEASYKEIEAKLAELQKALGALQFSLATEAEQKRAEAIKNLDAELSSERSAISKGKEDLAAKEKEIASREKSISERESKLRSDVADMVEQELRRVMQSHSQNNLEVDFVGLRKAIADEKISRKFADDITLYLRKQVSVLRSNEIKPFDGVTLSPNLRFTVSVHELLMGGNLLVQKISGVAIDISVKSSLLGHETTVASDVIRIPLNSDGTIDYKGFNDGVKTLLIAFINADLRDAMQQTIVAASPSSALIREIATAAKLRCEGNLTIPSEAEELLGSKR